MMVMAGSLQEGDIPSCKATLPDLGGGSPYLAPSGA